MGKTKIKTIDADTADKKPVRKLGRQDELVEKLKAELEGVGESSPKEEAAKPAVANEPKQKTQKPKQGKVKPRSKKYQEIVKDLDKSKTYPLTTAVELTKKLSYTKNVGTLEAHINTISIGIRGLVSLPFVSGKKLKILAYDGEDAIIEEISKGKIDFDLIVTTPAGMPKLAKVARILGPRGLMPNPKNGTIANDLKKAVESFQSGKTEYKTEQKAPVIHLGLGKLNQPTEELSANIKMLIQTLGKTRIKKVTLSPTMGPSVKLDLSSL